MTVSRHNPLVDPTLHVWQWQIPDLPVSRWASRRAHDYCRRAADGDSPRQREALVCCTIGPLVRPCLPQSRYVRAVSRPSHKLYVWRLYTTFQITSPMSWGSWILLLVYPALVANALAHLPEAIPALARRFPILITCSDFILSRTRLVVGHWHRQCAGWHWPGYLYRHSARHARRASLFGTAPAWPAVSLLWPLSAAAALLHGILVLPPPGEELPAFADFLLSSLTRLAQARPLDQKVGASIGRC